MGLYELLLVIALILAVLGAVGVGSRVPLVAIAVILTIVALLLESLG